jgi:response regulator of citrate/malate metabolism
VIDVLVVDDDFVVARIHSAFVQRTPGFRVVGAAHTGEAALESVRRLRPHLVLLDIYLPDINGIDVLRQLREEAPDVDVLVITAAREAETVRGALRGGVVHYLMKPFGYRDLRDRLEHYATTHRSLAQGTVAAQADVDRVFGARTTEVPNLPKGLSMETADLVESVLRKADDSLSAMECAELTGVSRVSARRYLEHFVALGKVDVRLRYGRAGRPERRYLWRPPDPSRS